MRNNLIGLLNLFCAICCQFEPGLPLMYQYSDEKFDFSDTVIEKMYDIAFDNLKLYKSLVAAKSKQEQQLIKLDLIELFEYEFRELLDI